ncbi:MAG: Ig-like domain-containing protein [Spirochaetales bacterium]|nr:Ig-like domain-containing protein [Spirochaetales bacterium]
MKKISTIWKVLSLSMLLFVIIFGCRNSLVNIIEDEVAVAVTAPEVLSIYPTVAAEDIPISLSTITATLSKPIEESSVKVSTFFVTDPSGTIINGSRQVDNETITFTPVSSLMVGTEYAVTIDGVTDKDGNVISELYTWSFTTGIIGDTVVPVISEVTLNEGAEWTNSQTVDVFIAASDNFGIAQMNVSTTGNFSDAGWNTWTPLLSVEFPDGDGAKTLYVKVKDGSGNVSEGIASAVIGLDTTAPIVNSFVIDGGKSGTRKDNVTVDILASDEDAGSGIFDYRIRLHGGEVWTVDDWTTLPESGIFIPVYSLSVSADETEIIELQVRDRAGNESLVIDRSITRDFTPPSINLGLSNPIPNSDDNKTKSYVKIAFDGEMNTSTFSGESINISKGADQISSDIYEIVDGKSALEFTEFQIWDVSEGDYVEYFLEQNVSYTVFISSSVSDVAGNTFEGDYSYSFSNGAFLDETAPIGFVVLDLDDINLNATPISSFDLEIKAEDDYNGVRAVKIWGDNNNTEALFESEATWALYSEGATTPENISYMSYSPVIGNAWPLPITDGDYFIYYKFVDYANNESDVPGILRVSLDTTEPVINNIFTDGGTGYSNNFDDTINIIFDAEDAGSGLKEMWFSVEASDTLNLPATKAFDAIEWQEWSSIISDYTLDSGEGKYFIYGEVKDHVDWQSGDTSGVADYTTVILDYTPPEIGFELTDLVETNRIALQTSTIVDNHPDGSLGYQIPSGVDSYSWEQVDEEGTGPGLIRFFIEASGETADSTVEEPYIAVGDEENNSITDGSVDGTYIIKVVAEDNAGNSAESSVEFVWDTLDPNDVGTLTAFVDVVVDEATGETQQTQFTTSDNLEIEYINYSQPYISWDSPNGADFFTIMPSSDVQTPNTPPGVAESDPAWYSYWDDPAIDWADSATYDNANKYFIRSEDPIVSPRSPTYTGQNDGLAYLYIAAWDNAGNRSNRTTDQVVKFWIDTLAPIITTLQEHSPINSTLTLDYHNGDNLGDGRVYDQLTSNDPSPDNRGSGIQSYFWAQTDGPGTLTITNGDTLTPSISAPDDGSEDGQYEVSLTVTDFAGNSATGYYAFEWDTTPPNVPVLTALDHTPNLSPTWSFTSGGNGNGTYRYRIDRIGRYNWNDPDESTGGAYYGSSEVVLGWNNITELFLNHGVLTDGYEYTLFVQEQDDAGNWSDSDSLAIWIDAEWTSAPSVTREGAYLRNGDAGAREVTWNWTTGTGTTGVQRYRVRLKNQSGSVEPGYDWTDLVDDDLDYFIDFSPSGENLDDGTYTLEVEEYNMSDPEDPPLVGKVGTSSVQIDSIAPDAPILNSKPGYLYSGQDDPDCYLTNDTTPYFRWSTGGNGGSGDYRWRFDADAWTYTRTYYMSPSKAEGVYIFEVQERDSAGNWSDGITHEFEIDATGPTLSGITLRNRATNPYNNYYFTTSTSINIDVSGSGSNNQTFTSDDVRYMRFWNEGGTKSTYYFNSTMAGWNFSNGGASAADGSKTVYCELVDYAGNVSLTNVSDYITLDTSAPTITNLNLDNGAEVATSTYVYLNSTLGEGAYKMRASNDNGDSWSSWYSDDEDLRLNILSSGNGAKNIIVQVTDIAGYYCRNISTQVASHYSSAEDAIFYGTPVIENGTKGLYSYGLIGVYYDTYPTATGLSTNTYELWASTTPGGTKTKMGETTNSSYYSIDVDTITTDNFERGQAYYVYLKVSNPDIGETFFSSNYALAFTSDMTIIYNDADADDTTLASYLKTWIKRDWASDYSSYFDFRYGSFLEYSVTLVPQDEIADTWYDEGTNETIIYGNPIITTPASELTYSSVNDYAIPRNIIMGAKGLMGMHYNGWRMFQVPTIRVADVATNWGYTEQLPVDLDYAYDNGTTQQMGTKEWDADFEYQWYRYLKHKSTYDNYRYEPDHNVTTFFTSSTNMIFGTAHRWSLSVNSTAGERDCSYWADDPLYSNSATVARQGEFVYWGYDRLPIYYSAAVPLLYNTVRYLNTYY